LLAVGAVLAFAVSAPAEPEGWSYDLAGELMSPFCPGRTLADCPSGEADQLRLWIRLQEASGRTREDVTAELVERFGDVVLPAPRAEGFGLAAYLIPVGVFVAGGLLVAVFLRRQTAVATAVPGGPVDPELERVIDEELAR
jgi:cytochrome c-type biogenesis protein CcmH/NrfF